jgi:hypothetical protein
VAFQKVSSNWSPRLDLMDGMVSPSVVPPVRWVHEKPYKSNSFGFELGISSGKTSHMAGVAHEWELQTC